jgi:hypothetical protein
MHKLDFKKLKSNNVSPFKASTSNLLIFCRRLSVIIYDVIRMSCRKDDCKHHVTMIHRLLLKFLFLFYKYLFRNGLHDNQSCDYFLIEFICSILKIVKLHSCIYALLSIYLLLAFSLGSCAAVSFCINNDEKMLKM